MEAMAMGIIVVSTNVGGIPYILTDKQEGFLVPPRDKDGLYNCLTELLENQSKLESISHFARLRATQWDWDLVKIQWKNLISGSS